MILEEEKKRYRKGLSNPTQEDIDIRSYEYALFKASMKRFFPKISNEDHIDMFKDYMYHIWISGLEQYDMGYLKKTTVINNSSIDLSTNEQRAPLIFSSFHFGSFRLLNSILYELGHKIVIIIAEDIFQKQEGEILNKVKPLLKGTKDSDFIILNVMKRASIFKLKNLISKGYIMTVYLDGNTGINTDSQSFTKGYIPINFLNKTIYVKNGIGRLAALLGAMIIPAISYRDKKEDNHLTFYKEIEIKDFMSKKEFSIKSIEFCYKKFEEALIKYPMQWGSWLNIHKWFKRDYTTPFKIKKENKICNEFNNERYTFFKLGKSNFIFDLFDYKSYPITSDLFITINQNRIPEVEPHLYKELATKNIII